MRCVFAQSQVWNAPNPRAKSTGRQVKQKTAGPGRAGAIGDAGRKSPSVSPQPIAYSPQPTTRNMGRRRRAH